jgi:hypothetical protein
VRNKSVLDEMMEDATAEGDYAAAGQVLQMGWLGLGFGSGLASSNPKPDPNPNPQPTPNADPDPDPNPNQVLEMALIHELTEAEVADEEVRA